MVSRLVAFAGMLFVASVAAGTAYAQAPGEVEPVAQDSPDGQYTPNGQYAPVVVDPSVPVRESVMAHRWAIGLSFGGLGVAPEENPDAQQKFEIGAIAIRYRAAPHIEFALELAGGRQVLDSGEPGDLDTDGVLLVGRYRFMPEEPWNLFLTGGFGGVVIARHDASDDERQREGRPQGMLGIGIERRFERFALQAEARIVGYGERENRDVIEPVSGTVGTGDAPKPPLVPPLDAPSDNLSGGTFTIGASYYW